MDWKRVDVPDAAAVRRECESLLVDGITLDELTRCEKSPELDIAVGDVVVTAEGIAMAETGRILRTRADMIEALVGSVLAHTYRVVPA